jgi:hypothetical protein
VLDAAYAAWRGQKWAELEKVIVVLVAEMSSTDCAQNRDPAMDAIRAYLAHRSRAGEGAR